MQAPQVLEAPGPESRPATPADDPDVPPWRAAYVTCPACHRPVRRERLSRHMELLHADAQQAAAGDTSPAAPAGSEADEGMAEPRQAGGLRSLLARLFSRRG